MRRFMYCWLPWIISGVTSALIGLHWWQFAITAGTVLAAAGIEKGYTDG
jgi:hypothetical protein